MGRALRQTSLAAAAALALGITLSFLCAAAFVYVLQSYGPIEACLAGAGVFFVVTLIAAGCYMARKRQLKARAAQTQKSTLQTALADPMLVARHSDRARNRRETPDPASGGGWIGVGISRDPRFVERSSAGGIIFLNLERCARYAPPLPLEVGSPRRSR